MKLHERLRLADIAAPEVPQPEIAKPAVPRESFEPVADPLSGLKNRAQESLFARLGSRLYDSSLSEEQLRGLVLEELGRVMEAERIPMSAGERHRMVAEVSNDVLGYGPIEQFLLDDAVTEVMVNADDAIYVEREGRLHRTDARFFSEEHLRRVIERVVSQVGRRIDESSPMVDARLPDGSRVNAVIPPLAVDGPALTIRKFSKDPFQVNDLIRFETLTGEMADLLRACVEGRLNILITGGTGTGKTTLLNVLSSLIPSTRPDRHHRGRGGAPAASGPCDPSRVPSAQHRGQGPGHHPRPGAQLAADAPRPDHRRRGAWRRDARHAPGDEHRPRRLAVDGPCQHPA